MLNVVYAECRTFIIMLSAIMMNVIRLSVVELIVVAPHIQQILSKTKYWDCTIFRNLTTVDGTF
jgi:hypothetical protein